MLIHSVDSSTTISVSKFVYRIKYHFMPASSNLIYCILCSIDVACFTLEKLGDL